jgi:hypothetical protein
MNHFTIHNAIDRIKATGDIFTGVLGIGINMGLALKTLVAKYGEQDMHKSIRGIKK